MNIIGLLFNQIVVMFILMCIGFIFYRIKFISDQGSKDIGKILLYLVVPIVIIKNFLIELNSESINALISSSIISAIAMFIAIVISTLVYGKKDGVSTFSSSFSNAAFIGIPLVSATLGSSAVFYISMMIVLINALQWTYGVFIMTGDVSVIKPRKIVTNPIIIAVIIGIILFLTQIQLPSLITNVLDIISGLNTPLAMIVSGVYLAQSDLKAMLTKFNIYKVSFIRLVIIPLVTLLVFRFIPFGNTTIKLAVLIAAACPVGSNVAIFAQAYNADYRSAVEQVCMSTIFCLITLVILTMFSSSLL